MPVSKKGEALFRQRRIFSKEFKRQKVQLIVDKLASVSELAQTYGLSPTSVYRWVYQHSPHHQRGSIQVVQMESEAHKTKELLRQVAELERAVGQKQLQIDYPERLLAVSGESLQMDLKKTFGGSALSGSASTSANTPTR
jgi:transposase